MIDQVPCYEIKGNVIFYKAPLYLSLFVLLHFCCVSEAIASCTISGCSCSATATAVSFGNYNPLSSTASQSTGTISVTCQALIAGMASYTIALNKGASTSFSPRTLKNGTSSLSYNLYTTSALSTIWGDGTGGTSTVSQSVGILVTPTQTNITVYGNLPGSQRTAVPGTYTDTITVTITY